MKLTSFVLALLSSSANGHAEIIYQIQHSFRSSHGELRLAGTLSVRDLGTVSSEDISDFQFLWSNPGGTEQDRLTTYGDPEDLVFRLDGKAAITATDSALVFNVERASGTETNRILIVDSNDTDSASGNPGFEFIQLSGGFNREETLRLTYNDGLNGNVASAELPFQTQFVFGTRVVPEFGQLAALLSGVLPLLFWVKWIRLG